MDRIIFQHDARLVADALRTRGRNAVADIDKALGRGAHEVAREAVQTMPKFRSRTATATAVAHMAPMHWEIGFGTRWASYTERGTGPGGRPPLGEILDWIRLKGIVPRDASMSRRDLAFVIRRSIARKGVPRQAFAEPALQTKLPRLRALVAAGARGALNRTRR